MRKSSQVGPDLTAAALSLLGKAQAALGRSEVGQGSWTWPTRQESAQSLAAAAEMLQKAGSKADSKLAKLLGVHFWPTLAVARALRLVQARPQPAVVKLGREELEKDTSLVTLAKDPDEVEAAQTFEHREAAARSQEQPTSLVRQAGLLVEATTSLPFQAHALRVRASCFFFVGRWPCGGTARARPRRSSPDTTGMPAASTPCPSWMCPASFTQLPRKTAEGPGR